MKAYSICLVLLLIGSFALGVTFIACENEGDENLKHPLMAEDGNNYAKDKDGETRCDVDDLSIEDCADACTCCFWGQEEGIEDCVEDCDQILFRYRKYPPAHTDVDNYKECVVGCWSICDKPDKMVNCWAECNIYVEDA